MNVRAAFLALSLLAAPCAALAQGFAGLGTEAEEGFAIPNRDTQLSFPADHGPHPDYRIEWWYLTANLQDAAGNHYGIQWTLFRSALAPELGDGWTSPQLWMGHAGLTTPDAHYSAERLARGGIGQAGVFADPFSAWIDEWRLEAPETQDLGDTLDRLQVSAGNSTFSYDLELTADGPLILQGAEGYSVKSREGQASYYYSQPYFEVAGTLDLPQGPVEVTGQGWLDREWSSQPLSESQTGWDWISLHLDTGQKLMGFRLRDRDGAPFTSATWIEPDGTAVPLPDGQLTLTPLDTTRVAGREIPILWRVTLPRLDLDIAVSARNPQAWMDTSFPYWEGPVAISGSHGGTGYLEMTGYAPASE